MGASQLDSKANKFCFKLVSIIVYRIFFHPLAKYPGPLLAKCSDWHAGYHAYRGDIHVDMLRCHDKYGANPHLLLASQFCPLILRAGDVVRYATNRILINTPSAVTGASASSSCTRGPEELDTGHADCQCVMCSYLLDFQGRTQKSGILRTNGPQRRQHSYYDG